MNRIILLLFAALLVLASCRSRRDGPTNEYKNAKTKTSTAILKEHQKAHKRSSKAMKKNERKARKKGNKRNGKFFEK